MNEELRKRITQQIHDAVVAREPDAILALFASSLVKARREAFCDGASWASERCTGDEEIEAVRRYPDENEADNDFTEEDEQSALEGYPDA